MSQGGSQQFCAIMRSGRESASLYGRDARSLFLKMLRAMEAMPAATVGEVVSLPGGEIVYSCHKKEAVA